MEVAMTLPEALPTSGYTGSKDVRLFATELMSGSDAYGLKSRAQARAHVEAKTRAHIQADDILLNDFVDATIIASGFALTFAHSNSSARIFGAIQSLYISPNLPRDRQIALRVTNLHRIVLAEGEHIQPPSIEQFAKFFIANPTLALPKIFVTPDGTMRARWTSAPDNFVAIEFMGAATVKLVAELPRADGKTATYFASEATDRIISTVAALGGSLG